jgi:hypothetical protein
MSAGNRNEQQIQAGRDAYVAGRDVHFFAADVPSQLAGDEARAILRPPIGRLPPVIRGRERLLSLLSRLIEDPDGRVHALAGVGGTGKSTIALATADRAGRSGHDVWWVTATDPVTVNSSLLALAARLGAQPERIEAALLGELSSADLLWSRLEARPGWVLVLDRVDDPEALSVKGRPVSDGRGWIRESRAGLLLVTTRNGDPRVWGRSVELHQVGWLNDLDGARVLADLAPGSGTLEEAGRLSARLGGLPLALHLAATYLAHNQSTFEQYEHRLQESAAGDYAAGDYSDRQIIGQTFVLSLDFLDRNGNADAHALMESLCWFAAGTPVPAAGLDAEAVYELSSIALIDRQAESADRIGEWIVIHPLVSEALRHTLTERGKDRQTAAAAVELLGGQTADLTPRDKQQWYAWLPHLESLLHLAGSRLEPEQLTALAEIAARLSEALSWAGDHDRAEALVGAALTEAIRLGKDNPAVIGLNLARATALQGGGDYSRAEELIRGIVPILDQLLGPDHPYSQNARMELAAILAAQDRLPEAEALLRQLLRDQSRILGSDDPRVLEVRRGLAIVLMRGGRYVEVEPLLRSLYADELRLLGPDHPGTLGTLRLLGWVSAATGRYEEATELLYRSVDGLTRVLGTAHPDTAEATYALAQVLAGQGESARAKGLLRDLLTAQEQALGHDDPAVAKTAQRLRDLEASLGRGPAAQE